MSETITPSAAPATTGPDIAVYKRGDGSLVAHVHVVDRLRTVFGRSIDDVTRRVCSTLISEFGMSQPDAEKVVEDHGLVPSPSAADMEAAHAAVEELHRELATAQQAQATAERDRDAARDELKKVQADSDAAGKALEQAEAERDALQATVKDLEAKLAVATQPLPMATSEAEVKPAEAKAPSKEA